MELPDPLGKGATTVRRRNATGPFSALAAGFLIAAFVVFAIVVFVGVALGLGHIPATGRILVAVLVCAAMCAVDVASLRKPSLCRLTLRRQTPKALEDRYGRHLGPLLWGIDTGTAVTTFRVSAATWAVLTLCLLQLTPWWVGLAYGAGFCLPLGVATFLLPWRSAPRSDFSGEPLWIQIALTRTRPTAQIGCLLTLLAVTGVLGAVVVGA
ncbi:MAG: hypothetical protein ACRDTC_03180 [Pseudonocardiaceae bacterium]